MIAESEESNNDQSEDENDFESDQSGKGIDKLMLRAEVRGIPWPIEKWKSVLPGISKQLF